MKKNTPEDVCKHLTIYNLGWSVETAIAVRGIFDLMSEDWDDPEMDAYDEITESSDLGEK